ncbi:MULTISPECIES: DUF2911 domain-containing protein [Algoriphagus]|uniref:DUF2911 domain-containing protein n=1 Tax=Algoriphagus boritolerans DSM 17298 = JCM 18970 TaxID=1120964 RepID=A0A1H5UD75_9BACT|nr:MULTISPECIES: DUF2911 domain-containing protein [Algoriphagus]MDP2040868.1 DUF2911 domain-containing protein [Algoriphagus sp.]MDP3470807.1 DUF2911 domain-containing protein [Algoriphagus sp.]SEF72378.1 Protein of unknown function [Algoriphagus boritolerans DSM 17298 = JCM 18970]
MKKLIIISLLAFSPMVSFAQHEHHQAQETIVKAKSPRTSTMAMIGDNHIHIDYGSPSVRGRVIWNGLVAYGQVWATGAHKATWIEFSEDVTINNQLIAKGKYGFFTIPNEEEWILILSKDWDMHLADDYNSENDLMRIKVQPKKNDNLTESLQYQVVKTNESQGKIEISWEFVSVSFDFKNAEK